MIGGVPYHFSIIVDGLAIRQGGRSTLEAISVACAVVSDIVKRIIKQTALKGIPENVATIQAGGNHLWCRSTFIRRNATDDCRPLNTLLWDIANVDIPSLVRAGGKVYVVIGRHISAVGLGQAAQRGPCGVGAHLAWEGLNSDIADPSAERPVPRLGIVHHKDGGAGIGVAVAQGDDRSILAHQHELVKGVADIAHGSVHHFIVGIQHGHALLVHAQGQVGLMVQSVDAGIHLMAGADRAALHGNAKLQMEQAGIDKRCAVFGGFRVQMEAVTP